MTDKTISYFLVGLGVGSMIAILCAPKSGAENREDLAQKARQASEYAQEKVRAVTESAENLVERGKQSITDKKEQIATAIQAGREAYKGGNQSN